MKQEDKTMPKPARTQPLSLPLEYYILAEWHPSPNVIGELNGKPIHECIIDDRGKTLRFAGIAPRSRNGTYNVACLRDGEWIVQPGLIYATDEQENSKSDPAQSGQTQSRAA